MTRYVASASKQEDERTATPVQTAGNAAIKGESNYALRLVTEIAAKKCRPLQCTGYTTKLMGRRWYVCDGISSLCNEAATMADCNTDLDAFRRDAL